jgi:hypothetical protein
MPNPDSSQQYGIRKPALRHRSACNATTSQLLVNRLGHHRRQRIARGVAVHDRRDRVQRALLAEAMMKCMIIAYIALGGGVAAGWIVPTLFRV